MSTNFAAGALDAFDTAPDFRQHKPAADSRAGNLRDQVHEALRAALISGQMKPGVLYSAPALAEMLGVSTTPVREAMLDLVREDLVVAERNKGFRVTAVSERELDELIETRLLLEVPIMGAVAAAYGPHMKKDMKRLRDLASALEEAASGAAVSSYLQLDTEFHTSFLALHGNSQVVKTVRGLRARTRLFGLEALAREGQLLATTQEHSQMIDLAEVQDRRGLEELTRLHLSHARTIWAH